MSARLEPHAANLDTEGYVAIRGSNGGVLHAAGDTVPTDGTAGYITGCLFIHTDGATVNTVAYVNIGNTASCDFDPLKG